MKNILLDKISIAVTITHIPTIRCQRSVEAYHTNQPLYDYKIASKPPPLSRRRKFLKKCECAAKTPIY